MKIGCQARSFGKGIYAKEEEFLDVVRQIGNLGFRGLEANWKNLEPYFDRPEVFKEILRENNLELIGAHYGAAHWDESARAQIKNEGSQIAGFVAAVGGQYIVCSGRRPTKGAVSDEMWQKTGEGLNLLGQACAPEGVKLAYHNHWWESEEEGLFQLAAYTDPSYIGFAFDTGHHVRAGKDPAELASMLLDRLSIIHLGDFSEDAGGNVLRPRLGTGILDLSALRTALEGFAGWLVLEEENSSPAPERQVAVCMDVMREFVNDTI